MPDHNYTIHATGGADFATIEEAQAATHTNPVVLQWMLDTIHRWIDEGKVIKINGAYTLEQSLPDLPARKNGI
jgi:hypothetical protein